MKKLTANQIADRTFQITMGIFVAFVAVTVIFIL